MAKKYYVVWEGRETGVYDDWNTCKSLVDGHYGAKYKSFPTKEEALAAYRQSPTLHIHKKEKSEEKNHIPTIINHLGNYPISNSLCVDAACSGNPGKMEYRGVDFETRKVVFHQGPYEAGTNNIGEFLAIVHGLAELKKQQSDKIIYTDSMTAISWVRKKKAATKLESTSKNEVLFQHLRHAENWLKNNTYSTKILKWDTEHWGEIPADFGRK
jgi:ribonuclease HI